MHIVVASEYVMAHGQNVMRCASGCEKQNYRRQGVDDFFVVQLNGIIKGIHRASPCQLLISRLISRQKSPSHGLAIENSESIGNM
jgi:hypothetical protein